MQQDHMTLPADEAAIGALLARADLCRFLSACYYQPTPMFTEERLFQSLIQVAQRVDPAFGEMARQLGSTFASTPLETLLVDYTKLFLGAPQALASPYGSVWLDEQRLVMGETTLAVLGAYQTGGFDLAEDFADMPDHIAVELEFLYLLLFREAQALQGGDRGAYADLSTLKADFLGRHLGLWAAPFSLAVVGAAQTDFYRLLADLTNRVVQAETAQP